MKTWHLFGILLACFALAGCLLPQEKGNPWDGLSTGTGGSWFNSTWANRIPFYIYSYNTTSNLEVRVPLNFSGMSNGSDMRITCMIAGVETEQYFWRHANDTTYPIYNAWNFTSASGDVWVNVTNTTANTNLSCFAYGAASTLVADKSNITRTFFWADEGHENTVASFSKFGTTQLGFNATGKRFQFNLSGGSFGAFYPTTPPTMPAQYVVEMDALPVQKQDLIAVVGFQSARDNNHGTAAATSQATDARIYIMDGGGSYVNITPFAAKTGQITSYQLALTSAQKRALITNANGTNYNATTLNTASASGNFSFGVNAAAYTVVVEFQNMRARTYLSTDPLVSVGVVTAPSPSDNISVNYTTGISKLSFRPLHGFSTNVQPVNQSSIVPLFNVTTAVAGTWKINISQSIMITGFTVRCAPNYNQTGLVTINTSTQWVSNVTYPASQGIWCWADFNNPKPPQNVYNIAVIQG